MEQNKEPRNKPSIGSELIFDKGVNNILWGKDTLLKKWC